MWGDLRGDQICEIPPGFHPGHFQSWINHQGGALGGSKPHRSLFAGIFPKNKRWDFLCPALQTDKHSELTDNIQNSQIISGMNELPTFPALGKNSLERFKSLIPYSSFAPRRSCYTKVETSPLPAPAHHIPAHSGSQEIKLNSSHQHPGAPGASQKPRQHLPVGSSWECWEWVGAPAH